MIHLSFVLCVITGLYLESAMGQTVFGDTDCLERCNAGLVETPCLISIVRTDEFFNARGSALEIHTSALSDRLILSENNFGVRDFNMTDPLVPRVRGQLFAVGETGFDGALFNLDDDVILVVDDNELVVVNSSFGIPLQIVNYTTVSSAPISGGTGIILNTQRTHAFVADGDAGLRVFDIQNISNPSQIFLSTPTLVSLPAVDIILGFSAGIEWIALGGNEPAGASLLFLFDITDPANPVSLSELLIEHDIADLDVDSSQSVIFLGGESQASLIDCSDPRNPSILASVTVSGQISDVDLADGVNGTLDRVYAIHDNSITVWDVTDPLNPQRTVTLRTEDLIPTWESLGLPTTPYNLDDVDLSSNRQYMWASAELSGLYTFCTGDMLRRTAPQSDNTGVIVGATIGAVCGTFILCAICGACGFFAWRRQKNRAKNKELHNASEDMPLSHKVVNYLTNVKQGKAIAKGNFGEVYQGDWNGCKVALKTLSSEDIKELENEVTVLKRLDHPHVLHFYGLTVLNIDEMKVCYIVTELMDRGDLLRLLQNEQHTEPELVNAVFQAGVGMAYLHSQNVIHRDLACRNLLVNGIKPKWVIKVADFGLSRAAENYYNASTTRPLPIRWTAPEAIEFAKFGKPSDVWSFGVVVWEIFSRGAIPYSGLTNLEVIEQIQSGYRLKPPANMPQSLINMVTSCWNIDTHERPTFDEILLTIRAENNLSVIEDSEINNQRADTYQDINREN